MDKGMVYCLVLICVVHGSWFMEQPIILQAGEAHFARPAALNSAIFHHVATCIHTLNSVVWKGKILLVWTAIYYSTYNKWNGTHKMLLSRIMYKQQWCQYFPMVNESHGHAKAADLIGLPENKTADGAQPRICLLVPRPFSSQRLGTRLAIRVLNYCRPIT